MGAGEDAEVGPMSLCLAHGLKGWSGNQLGGEENMQNAWAPCSGVQGLGPAPLCESAL